MKLRNRGISNNTTVNLITGIFTMGFQLIINFFLSPYIVKNIGEAANGFTQLANNFVSYASLITLTFTSMGGRFIAVNYHRGKRDKVNLYYSAVMASNIFISVILIPAAVCAVLNLNRLIVIESSDYKDVQILFAFVFLNFFLSLIYSQYSMSFYVTNRIYVQNCLNLLRVVTNAVLLLLVFLCFTAKIYFVSMIACLLSLMQIICCYNCKIRYMPFMKFSFQDMKLGAVAELVKSGIWNTVNQCGNMLMTGLDLLLSNLFVDPVSMGVLSVAKIIPNAIIQLATILNTSFAPELTKDWAQGNEGKVLLQLRKSMKISSVVISVPIITFCVFSSQFYQLWMPTMEADKLAVLSFLSCMAFIPWAGPQILYNVFTTTNRLKANAITFLIAGLVNICVTMGFVKYTDLGIYAIAGISSAVSIVRSLTFTAPYTAHLLNLKWNTFYMDVLISMSCCGINALVGMGVRTIFHLQGWVGMTTMVLITCVVTIACEMFVILNKEERLYFINCIQSWKK